MVTGQFIAGFEERVYQDFDIVEGGYSNRFGVEVGLGFVPAVALEEFFEVTIHLGCRGKVLPRQPDILRYRSAMMTVVI